MGKRIFSGIQPTGAVHIGNYVGAIRQWVNLQHEYESFFCIVDYHAITIPYEAAEMPKRVFEAVVGNIAAGLDPTVSTIFIQSHVPEHTEMTWIFNSITPMGWLGRMTQFKEKSEQFKESVNVGLYDYPVLQAADILLYKAEVVPVGEDQVQHVELTRDIARKFNSTFGETFPEPEAVLNYARRIMALNDPTKKMSKSIPGSFIALSDSPEEIREKMMKAVTDAGPMPGAEMSAGTANLFVLLRAFSPPETVERFEGEYERGAIRYSEVKEALSTDIAAALAPVRAKREELLSKPEMVYDILRQGANKARGIAKETMQEVKEIMGLE